MLKLLLKPIIALLCLGFIATLSLRPDILMRFKTEGLKAFLPKQTTQLAPALPSAPDLSSLLPQTPKPKPEKSTARKQLYRWQDEKGQWHYTDAPPPTATNVEGFKAPDTNLNVLSFEGVRAQAQAQEDAKQVSKDRVHIVGEDSSSNTSQSLKDSPALQGIRDMEKRQAEQQRILDQL